MSKSFPFSFFFLNNAVNSPDPSERGPFINFNEVKYRTSCNMKHHLCNYVEILCQSYISSCKNFMVKQFQISIISLGSFWF